MSVKAISLLAHNAEVGSSILPPSTFPGEVLHRSRGALRYSENPYRLIVEVDPEIVAYYRSLIPKSIVLNKQKYPPHISVVRHETPVVMDMWGAYDGKLVGFQYSNLIRHGVVYYWIDAFSRVLQQIRIELGLPPMNDITKPPDHRSCFHITVGNIK